MPRSALHFGPCELRIDSHELRVKGVVQPLEPTVFALLAYLVRHRGRAVPKGELLDAVWPDRDVSLGSLVRAVRQVRRAIGDVAAKPLIRTMHRVGYRFEGAVVESSADSAAAAASGRLPIPVALMPFENRTGDLGLEWTALGLMALVSNALALDDRLAPLPVHAVASAMRNVAPFATAQMRAQSLRQATGVDHVVQAHITRSEEGFRLEYELPFTEPVRRGVVVANDPIRLGRLLARRLLMDLFVGTPADVDGFALHDPWCMQLYGRATQAMVEHDWRRAMALLRVVVDFEHDYPDARQAMDRAQTMAARSDRAALARAGRTMPPAKRRL